MPGLQRGEQTLVSLVSVLGDEDGLMLAREAAEVAVSQHDGEDFLAAHLGVDEFRKAPLRRFPIRCVQNHQRTTVLQPLVQHLPPLRPRFNAGLLVAVEKELRCVVAATQQPLLDVQRGRLVLRAVAAKEHGFLKSRTNNTHLRNRYWVRRCRRWFDSVQYTVDLCDLRGLEDAENLTSCACETLAPRGKQRGGTQFRVLQVFTS